MQDIKTVIEKLHCYRLKMRPELCTDRSCPYNNNDPEYGFWCCSNRLLHDAETLLRTYQMERKKTMPRLIDADALLSEWEENPPSYDMDGVRRSVINAPTVQYTPASESAWVKLTGMMPPEYCGRHECQHCGFIQNYHFREVLYPYCPRCGSKMKNGVSADDI